MAHPFRGPGHGRQSMVMENDRVQRARAQELEQVSTVRGKSFKQRKPPSRIKMTNSSGVDLDAGL